MMEVPVLPRVLEEVVEEGHSLEMLRHSEGYRQFLYRLDELRALNYYDILNSKGHDETISAVAEARALLKVRRLVDDRIAEGAALTAELDAQVAKVSERQAAAQRAFTPRVDPRYRRTGEAG